MEEGTTAAPASIQRTAYGELSAEEIRQGLSQREGKPSVPWPVEEPAHPIGPASQRAHRPFHIMAKPSGPGCNMDCSYCFYTPKEEFYPGAKKWRMNDEVLESYVRQYIEAQPMDEVHFAWQGGEPTLMGLDFFKKAFAFQKKYANGKTIHNAFQTNGLLLDEEWVQCFAEEGVLVGLSIDGPVECHDRYRLDRGGHGTAYRVLRALKLLQDYKAEFNTLTCVHAGNADRPLEVYRFLRDIGSQYLQFIPIVERPEDTLASEDAGGSGVPPEGNPKVYDWSVTPEAYGNFYCKIFDHWVRRDVGRVFVQLFDIALEAWLGYPPSLCVYAPTCGNALALEHNGDIYACDHYVYPGYRRGNLQEIPLSELVTSDAQQGFGASKAADLPQYCQRCEVRFACNGGCPKYRFTRTPDGEYGLNYLCPGYKKFFHHVDPYMRFMADEIRASRSPANVMRFARMGGGAQAKPAQERNAQPPRPNDPCSCGSGRKYKKCCGAHNR